MLELGNFGPKFKDSYFILLSVHESDIVTLMIKKILLREQTTFIVCG